MTPDQIARGLDELQRTLDASRLRAATAHAAEELALATHAMEAQAEVIRALRPSLATLRETVQDFAANWDCDEDSHRYGTPCRCCESTKASAGIEAVLRETDPWA